MATTPDPGREVDVLDPVYIRKRYAQFLLDNATDDIADTVAQEVVAWEIVQAIAAEFVEVERHCATLGDPGSPAAVESGMSLLGRFAIRAGRACTALVGET